MLCVLRSRRGLCTVVIVDTCEKKSHCRRAEYACKEINQKTERTKVYDHDVQVEVKMGCEEMKVAAGPGYI